MKMKTVHGRSQGTWAHPALFEIGKAVGHCKLLDRDRYGGPCETRKHLTREGWCENCIAGAALDDLKVILTHKIVCTCCKCEHCKALADFIQNGAENDKKFGLGQ